MHRFFPLLCILVLLLGCIPENPSTLTRAATTYHGNGPLKITCTTGMVADLVKNIAGDRAVVTQLMGPGVDPHLYKSSPGDVAALSSADMVFYSGLHLEGRMTDLLEQLAQAKPVVAVAGRISESQLLHDGTHDPHVWFDVSLWQQAGAEVLRALCQFDPAETANYEQRFTTYKAKLEQLHQFCVEELKKIPEGQRVLVTAHDAFQYFGRAYGVEVRGIQGVSTDSEAGVKQINELVDFLVQRKIKAVFVESSVSEENVRSLLEGCRAQNHEVVIGGELFSDAMGEAGTPEGTYEGMIQHNVMTIVKALQ